MTFPEGFASPTAQIAALYDQAAWFRRMGNSAAEVATRRAIARIKRREAKIDRWFEMTQTVEEMPMRVPGGDAR